MPRRRNGSGEFRIIEQVEAVPEAIADVATPPAIAVGSALPVPSMWSRVPSVVKVVGGLASLLVLVGGIAYAAGQRSTTRASKMDIAAAIDEHAKRPAHGIVEMQGDIREIKGALRVLLIKEGIDWPAPARGTP